MCGTDLHAFKGNQPYFQYPRILGHEISGTVADTGGSTSFSMGEPVTIIPYVNCGECLACSKGKTNCCSKLSVIGVHQDGGMAEYLSIPERYVIAGDGLELDALATVEPLAIGTHATRRAALHPGEKVVILGAGPIGIGIAAAALSHSSDVLIIEPNPNRRYFCEKYFHKARVFDPGKKESLNLILEHTSGNLADVVIDATGSRMAIESMPDYLAHGGRMVLVGLQKEKFSFSHPDFHRKESTLMSSRNATLDDFQSAKDLLLNGSFPLNSYLTHRLAFAEAAQGFSELLKDSPESPCRSLTSTTLIKAQIDFD